ncbi:cytidine/deoxycytidylate deaminase zinc-binding domain protein [Tribonema minus]|uniref:tRNA(adenine(34)) deaminase n=1 Tax=Tribonema minus TaxID=303371 RepID=A0A835YXH5_9STRA|nr:cytidine/deoxycytidylate deaminase zinc-binding domain protein [Tribonema minus]
MEVDDTDLGHMRTALQQAKEAFDAGEVPIGAVVVCGGDVVAAAGNAVERSHDASAHAEVLAMRAAAQRSGNWRLTGCTLYATLEPCAMCLSAAYLFRVDRIVYGASDVRMGGAGGWVDLTPPAVRHPFHAALAVTGGVLAPQSVALLRGFFQQQRRRAPGSAAAPSAAAPAATPVHGGDAQGGS